MFASAKTVIGTALAALLIAFATPSAAGPDTFNGVDAFTPGSEWAPEYVEGWEPWQKHIATAIPSTHKDQFVYHGRTVVTSLPQGEPSDGTFTIMRRFGGSVKGRITFDYRRNIVFLTNFCCSTGEQLLALSRQPRHHYADSDLSSVHTKRGIALGDSVRKVREVDGYAPLRRIAGHPDLTLIAYRLLYDPKGVNQFCGQAQNFVFRDDRLVYLSLTDGC